MNTRNSSSLVRETKGTLNLEDLEWGEAMLVRFARRHFEVAPQGRSITSSRPTATACASKSSGSSPMANPSSSLWSDESAAQDLLSVKQSQQTCLTRLSMTTCPAPEAGVAATP